MSLHTVYSFAANDAAKQKGMYYKYDTTVNDTTNPRAAVQVFQWKELQPQNDFNIFSNDTTVDATFQFPKDGEYIHEIHMYLRMPTLADGRYCNIVSEAIIDSIQLDLYGQSTILETLDRNVIHLLQQQQPSDRQDLQGRVATTSQLEITSPSSKVMQYYLKLPFWFSREQKAFPIGYVSERESLVLRAQFATIRNLVIEAVSSDPTFVESDYSEVFDIRFYAKMSVASRGMSIPPNFYWISFMSDFQCISTNLSASQLTIDLKSLVNCRFMFILVERVDNINNNDYFFMGDRATNQPILQTFKLMLNNQVVMDTTDEFILRARLPYPTHDYYYVVDMNDFMDISKQRELPDPGFINFSGDTSIESKLILQTNPAVLTDGSSVVHVYSCRQNILTFDMMQGFQKVEP